MLEDNLMPFGITPKRLSFTLGASFLGRLDGVRLFTLLLFMTDKASFIDFSKFALKQIKKLPSHIKVALFAWVETVEDIGIRKSRLNKGYHDEPLKGRDRKGQRSVRLSKAYRAYYEENEQKEIILIQVQEVNKHDY